MAACGARLVLRGERALGALDLTAELLDGALVLGRVGAMLALEHLQKDWAWRTSGAGRYEAFRRSVRVPLWEVPLTHFPTHM
eukprot:5490598-Pleurochrysis_carterae.AAC.3